MHSDLLSTVEVAARLRVHHATVARMVLDGRLAARHRAPGPRGAFLFDPAEVERFAASRRGVSA
ncbi:helix-turn-helix domain-containing protein [Rhodococcus sp. NPDC006774]|uniref:helix-turn-helix domain-containing protein n=1 Tax=Rhodococcus sp. NPDC006774 TaxID=3157186 RepID=UPI0033E85469